MKIPYISISRKGVWDECQARYKFKYHLDVDPGEDEPFYFTYGKIIHKIAEEYVSNACSQPISEVAQAVLTGKLEIENGVKAPRLPADYKARMPDHLRSVKKLTDQIGYDGLFEQEFFFDLDPPNECFVKGVIDRLITRENRYFILDYKTSKKGRYRKTAFTIKSDLQLRTYARAVQLKYNVPAENIKAALYYLEGGNLIPTGFTQKALDSVQTELLETYHQIKNTEPDQAWGRVGDHCRRCLFRKMCLDQYCPGGSAERIYFSDENGKRIDAIRSKIEQWYKTGTLRLNEYYFFICALLEAADRVANTASVYGAFLKKLKRTALQPLVLKPAAFEVCLGNHKASNLDANKLIQHISGDILYLDPPYNHREYGANYHLLNTIAKYEAFQPKGKTGLPSYNRSAYCSRKLVVQEFEQLIKNAQFKCILLSYNNEGLMPLRLVENIMKQYGEYELKSCEYKRFKADKNRTYESITTTEYLHVLRKA